MKKILVCVVAMLSFCGATVQSEHVFSHKKHLVLGGVGEGATFHESTGRGYSISGITAVSGDDCYKVNIYSQAKPDFRGDAWVFNPIEHGLAEGQFESVQWNHVSNDLLSGIGVDLGRDVYKVVVGKISRSLSPIVASLKTGGHFHYRSGEFALFGYKDTLMKAYSLIDGCVSTEGFSFLDDISLFTEVARETQHTFRSTTSETVRKGGTDLMLLGEETLTRYNKHYNLLTPEILARDQYKLLSVMVDGLKAAGLTDIKIEIVVRSFSPCFSGMPDVFSDKKVKKDWCNPRFYADRKFDNIKVYWNIEGVKV